MALPAALRSVLLQRPPQVRANPFRPRRVPPVPRRRALPERRAHRCWRRPADRWLGAHPVSVFAKLEVAFKLSQLGVLWLYLGDGGRAAALASVQSAPAWCWQVGGGLILVGQSLNLAIYRAIGNDGVYYGFKLGRTVPWCSGFPFNIGLRHPQ